MEIFESNICIPLDQMNEETEISDENESFIDWFFDNDGFFELDFINNSL